jgi:activator of 2-hydroxyglutaryl-CoA dehydratase
VLHQSGGHLTDEQYEQASGGTGSFLEEMAKVLVSLRGEVGPQTATD